MSESAIKEKAPDLHALVLKAQKTPNWDHIKEDLELLYFLDLPPSIDSTVIGAVLFISDLSASSHLTLFPRFNVLKIVKVKMTISSYFAKVSEKSKIKEISSIIFDRIQHFEFFDKSQNSLARSGPDTFASCALMINDLFGDLKKVLGGVLMHFEKHLKTEFSQNLCEILDNAFYEKVIFSNKARLNQDTDTKRIVTDLEKLQKSKTSSDDSNLSASAFAHKGENKYLGELNESNQRSGYGKIKYDSGDTYEGNWFRNKRHGQGLYEYRFGGKYLGEFESDLPNGQGVRIYNTGNVYKGSFVAGKKHGYGELRFKNGDFFEGHWENDEMHGEGKYCWTTGDSFFGTFLNDKREGNGVLHLASGEVFEGVWKAGVLVSELKTN